MLIHLCLVFPEVGIDGAYVESALEDRCLVGVDPLSNVVCCALFVICYVLVEYNAVSLEAFAPVGI